MSEALTNAAKHANASRVDIEAAVQDSSLRLSIRDDGIGGADPTVGSGLIGLRDRVEALGGSIEINGQPGQGTHVAVQLPLGFGLSSRRNERISLSQNAGTPVVPENRHPPDHAKNATHDDGSS